MVFVDCWIDDGKYYMDCEFHRNHTEVTPQTGSEMMICTPDESLPPRVSLKRQLEQGSMPPEAKRARYSVADDCGCEMCY